MSRPAQRLLASLAAVAAVAYLIAMVVTGALPENRQVVSFEAAGVLQQAPDLIKRVAVTAQGGSLVFVRRDGGWVREAGGTALDSEAARALDRALTIMHNSKPVRVLAAEEFSDSSPDEYGLAQPRLSVTLEDASGAGLEAYFGASNTDGVLQFMSVKGSDRLFLMSDFVGQSWEKVLTAQRGS